MAYLAGKSRTKAPLMTEAKSQTTIPAPIQPAFILVRPQMGENIGATARAMLNFGLDRMRIVEPRDGWPNPKANALASGAGRVLDAAGIFPDVPRAIADCDFVFATTGLKREMVKPVVTPERAMQMVREMAAAGKKVGILFGPERTGLENEDVALRMLSSPCRQTPISPVSTLANARCWSPMNGAANRSTCPPKS